MNTFFSIYYNPKLVLKYVLLLLFSSNPNVILLAKLKLETCVRYLVIRNLQENGKSLRSPTIRKDRKLLLKRIRDYCFTNEHSRRLIAPKICTKLDKSRSKSVWRLQPTDSCKTQNLFGLIAVKNPCLSPQSKKK